MKLREKLAQEHPENINEDFMGGCIGCPASYGYSNMSLLICGPHNDEKCRKCWDKEYIPPEEKSDENVDHPQHYGHGQFETIEEMRIMFGDEAVRSFCILNAYKYKARAQYKGNAEEDLKKADWYLNYAKNMEKEK